MLSQQNVVDIESVREKVSFEFSERRSLNVKKRRKLNKKVDAFNVINILYICDFASFMNVKLCSSSTPGITAYVLVKWTSTKS